MFLDHRTKSFSWIKIAKPAQTDLFFDRRICFLIGKFLGDKLTSKPGFELGLGPGLEPEHEAKLRAKTRASTPVRTFLHVIRSNALC